MKLSKGAAPPVAKLNATAAQANIRAKCDAMRDWLATEPSLTENGQVGFLPRTKRQFNLWHCAKGGISTSIPAVELKSSSNETLNKLEMESQLLVVLLAQIDDYETRTLKRQPVQRMASLKRDLRFSERLREIGERELKEILAKNEELASENRRIKAELTGTIEEAKSRIAQLEKDLQAERKASSALAKTIRTSNSLRVV